MRSVAGVAISMDGKGRWIDNVFIERLWHSVKYEEVYLRAYANGPEARASLQKYFAFYNARRLHENLIDLTLAEVHEQIGRNFLPVVETAVAPPDMCLCHRQPLFLCGVLPRGTRGLSE